MSIFKVSDMELQPAENGKGDNGWREVLKPFPKGQLFVENTINTLTLVISSSGCLMKHLSFMSLVTVHSCITSPWKMPSEPGAWKHLTFHACLKSYSKLQLLQFPYQHLELASWRRHRANSSNQSFLQLVGESLLWCEFSKPHQMKWPWTDLHSLRIHPLSHLLQQWKGTV